MRSIAMEEHFVPPEAESFVPAYRERRDFVAMRSALSEVLEGRLRSMDAGGVELAVLSVTSPGLQAMANAVEAARVARQWNDLLYELVDRSPDRFRGFAALPMSDPEQAANELRRSVGELGFVGGLVNGYDDSGGESARYYDAPEYRSFWHAVEELDTVIYLHPRTAPGGRTTTYSVFPELAGSAWGFHVETAEHVLRLMLSGLLDEIPGLRLIVGHLGEILPFMAWRIDHMLGQQRAIGTDLRYKSTVSDYLRRNIWITTSGFFDTAALMHALSVVGADRIMYSVDYPYESMIAANSWFETLDLSDHVKEDISHRNARRVLKIA